MLHENLRAGIFAEQVMTLATMSKDLILIHGPQTMGGENLFIQTVL